MKYAKLENIKKKCNYFFRLRAYFIMLYDAENSWFYHKILAWYWATFSFRVRPAEQAVDKVSLWRLTQMAQNKEIRS